MEKENGKLKIKMQELEVFKIKKNNFLIIKYINYIMILYFFYIIKQEWISKYIESLVKLRSLN